MYTTYGPHEGELKNKAGYTATLVACWWARAVIKKANHVFGQEQ